MSAKPTSWVPVEALTSEFLRDILEMNVVGLLRVVQAFLPVLRVTGGRVVLISGGVAGVLAPVFQGAHTMVNQALAALGQSLQAELLPLRTAVSVVQTGAVRTRLDATELDFGPLVYGEPSRRALRLANTGQTALKFSFEPLPDLEVILNADDYSHSRMSDRPILPLLSITKKARLLLDCYLIAT